MSKNEIAKLAVRLMAMYAVIQAIPHIGWIATQFILLFHAARTNSLDLPAVINLLIAPLSFVMLIAVGVWLWVKADWLGQQICGEKPPTQQPVTPWDASTAQTIAFSVIGLFLVTLAIPNLIVLLLQQILRASAEPESTWASRQPLLVQWLKPIEAIVQLGLGTWLLLRSRGLVNALSIIRGNNR